MSSTAHWLVLDAVASRERVLSTWETEHLTHRHAHTIATLSEHKHLHRQEKKTTCLFNQVHSGVLSPPVVESWSCIAVHQLATTSLPPTSMLRPSLSSANVILSCVGGEGAAILGSLKETGEKLTSSSTAASAEFASLFLPSNDSS